MRLLARLKAILGDFDVEGRWEKCEYSTKSKRATLWVTLFIILHIRNHHFNFAITVSQATTLSPTFTLTSLPAGMKISILEPNLMKPT